MSFTRSYLVVFWNPFPIFGMDPCIRYFSAFFRRYGDIQCLQCENEHDDRSLLLMRRADLVVVTLRQSHRELCSLFCSGRIRFSNCVFLIMDYVPGGVPDLARIIHEFRIPPTRLTCLPYSPRIREDKKGPDAGPFTSDLRRELTHAGQIMLLALGF